MLYKRSLFALFVLMLVAVPFAQAQSVCSSDGTLEEITTTFSNDTHTDVTVHWLNTDCVEQDGTPIAAGESIQLTTFDGHEFIFRDGNGDSVLMLMVNTLNADSEISLSRTIAEGAAALVMWETLNPAREELGLQPIYFSGVLYDIAVEAAETADGDYSVFGSSIAEIALGRDVGWAGNSEGPRDGELASVSEVAARMTRSVQEYLDSGDEFGWFNPEVQSFAIYSSEDFAGSVFSTKSQPTLAIENQETASEIQEIESVSVVSGTLSGSVEMNYYTFEAEEGVSYGISLVSSDFDTYLRVYDADGNEVATNDDGGEGLNALLVFTADNAGTYTIGIDSYVDQASGSYVLATTQTSTVILDFVTADNPVRSNELDVEEGTMYFVLVNSEEFDTVLSILDENGTEIASDDDGGDGTNSSIAFTAPSTGTYILNVRAFGGESTGEYNVLIGVFDN